MNGNNSLYPELTFFDSEEQIKSGYRVVTSGSDGVFVPDLLVGSIIKNKNKFYINLAADFANIEFLRVLRSSKGKSLRNNVDLLVNSSEN